METQIKSPLSWAQIGWFVAWQRDVYRTGQGIGNPSGTGASETQWLSITRMLHLHETAPLQLPGCPSRDAAGGRVSCTLNFSGHGLGKELRLLPALCSETFCTVVTVVLRHPANRAREKMCLVALNAGDGYGQSRPSAVGMLLLWETKPSLREGASSGCITKIMSTFSQNVKNAI